MSLVMASILLAAAQPAATISNGNFSKGSTGWVLDEISTKAGYRLTIKDGVARLDNASPPPPGELAVVSQELDAKGWRGRHVQFSGRVRMTGSGSAGLRVLAGVKAPERRLLRTASPASAVPGDGKWRTITLHGRVGADADILRLVLYGTDTINAEFDDLSLKAWTPPKTPMSAEASKQLDDALAYIRKMHFNAKDNKDWPKLEAQARADAAGSQTIADVEPAITALLGDLNEHHASYRSPDDNKRSTDSLDAPNATPSVALVDGRFGHVTITSIGVGDEASSRKGRAYVDKVRSGLAALDSKPLCGWIVDLRGNGGGTTHVMTAAISGLALFDKKDWPDEYEGDVGQLPEWARWLITIEDQKLLQGAKPVAVLFDDQTGSAGEDTALRFVGRPMTRSFGVKSAGFTSGNTSKRLAGGWVIVVPAGYMHDRKGNLAKDGVTPDVVTSDAMGAAKAWLAGQCPATPAS